MQRGSRLIFAGLVLLGGVLVTTAGFIAWQPWSSTGGAEDPQLVVDGADLLGAEQSDRIAEFHELLRANHDIDYRVVTRDNVDDIDRFAAEAFRRREVGSASDAGHGLMLVIDPASDVLRIEVSRSLEPVYVDAFVAYIEQRQMTEFFAHDRVADGILATTEMIVTRAQRAEANAGLKQTYKIEGSAGGGAKASARLDDGPSARQQGTDQQVRVEGDGPVAVLEAYRRAMANRNDNTDLAIYSARTREFMAGRPRTPAQADNTARSLRQCSVEGVQKQGDRAVVRYPIDARQCPPYFFVREEGRWRLDLVTMHKVVQMNHENEWGITTRDHPYQFAFEDWKQRAGWIPSRGGQSHGSSLVRTRYVEQKDAYYAKTQGVKLAGDKRSAVRGNGRFIALSGRGIRRGEGGAWRLGLVASCIDDAVCWEDDAAMWIKGDGERVQLGAPVRSQSRTRDANGRSLELSKYVYRLRSDQLRTLAEASDIRVGLGGESYRLGQKGQAMITGLYDETAP